MANIAIFRINYKSDFILTLNSDAGWLTPFCIKFWTGAPSQAYFAGYDGTTYTHCAPVDGEPTKLLVQFDDHHLPLGDLKYQIAYHFTVADFPTSVEDEVLNQASVIIEVNDAPAQVMLDFNGETAPEIQFSLPAYANEAQRIENEQQRIANEQQRIQNEETRIAQEETRQRNEATRIAQEEARVSEFARLKHESQQATTDANDAATLANQKAQLAADKAALADDAATLANQKAQLAADKAALANDAAQLANEKAALAQQKAEYAQQQGGYAKDQGDYAKNQGDYAKEQGDTALADHQRAEADHGTAVDDHTQAGNDHTRAESDHGIAADDHTQAGNDHTRAESDHGIAADDHTQAGNDHTRAESDHSIAADDHTQAGNDHTRAESDHTRAESDHAAVEVYVDSLGAFDISSYHATGGVLAKYADLTAALGTNGANIPEGIRKGGMSVKFVQSSDNKYVQFRYMSSSIAVADFTNVANWQGVDDEPTAGSNNMVKSGGVHNAITKEESIRENLSLRIDSNVLDVLTSESGTILVNGNKTTSGSYTRWFVKNNRYSKVEVCAYCALSFAQIAFYNSDTPNSESLIESYAGAHGKRTYAYNVPDDCVTIGFSTLSSTIGNYFYYKLFTKDIVFTSAFQFSIDNLQEQIIDNEVAYNEKSFAYESGTILIDGRLSTSTDSVRWLIKNDNFRHIDAYLKNTINHACLAFYNSEVPGENSLIASYRATGGRVLYQYDVPDNCKLIGICTYLSTLTEDNPTWFKICVKDLTALTNEIHAVDKDLKFKIGDSGDIISLNNPLDLEEKLTYFSRNKAALTLLHFSDLHHNITNLQRIVQFRNAYNEYISDSICTGDLVYNLYTDPLDWDTVEGSEDILRTIGNHETALVANVWSGATAEEVYDKFLGDVIDGWNVTHENKNNYYYKDYTQSIRLIVLDPYYNVESQNTWLQAVLSDAYSKSLSVIIAEHNPFRLLDCIECSFTEMTLMLGKRVINATWGNYIQPFVESVDAFQNYGGELICWIAGHTHCDIMSIHHDYPNQLMLTASTANAYSDSTKRFKLQDNFNLYSFDTTNKLITIYRIGCDIDQYMRHIGTMCIRYDTKEVLWND